MMRVAIGMGTMLVCAALAGPAAAAGALAAATQGEVAVLAGGIGEDEQRALLAREYEYNLKLVFSLVQGNYLADVDVTVADAKGGRIVAWPDPGPFLLARLPAGEYSVTATHGNKVLTRKVRVTASRLRTEHLRWPADPEQDLPVSRWLEKE